jgi:hypothetical protein
VEGQVRVFISPRNRVVQLYARALGSVFVASYDLQSYGGGILTHLHNWIYLLPYIIIHNQNKLQSLTISLQLSLTRSLTDY